MEQGNSLLVIEHNLEVIKCADYVLDLGPEAGVDGGLVVAEGTPEEVAECEESHTGRSCGRCCGPVEGDTRVDALDLDADDGAPRARKRRGTLPIFARNPVVRRARAQSEEHLARHPARPDGGHHRPERLGKSTLAFDLLFAEGQRRFLDSMSAYARQFVEQLERPDVD